MILFVISFNVTSTIIKNDILLSIHIKIELYILGTKKYKLYFRIKLNS